MLIKEYRILMPFSVDEYRRGQLYMIQKKSRLESSGAGSRVEIHENHPYEDGPGGTSGQYTYKIYHIGDRIPAWIKSLLPSSVGSLAAHEEAWNAYPYTRTRYTCPLLDKFSVDVETRYLNDAGSSENVFQLTKNELKEREIDVMDFVNDPISSHDYHADEDPSLYKSQVTQRGPLQSNWVEEVQREGQPIMCAYKQCKVEFRYWGLQSRLERWIHDLALRGTMLRAHRQAWAWQDEWVGLTMEDIRSLEKEAQHYLARMAVNGDCRLPSLTPSLEAGPVGKGNQKGVGEEEETSSKEEGLSWEKEAGNGAPNGGAVRSESGEFYYDCYDRFVFPTPAVQGEKGQAKLIRWNSELLFGEGEGVDEEGEEVLPDTGGKRVLVVLAFHSNLRGEMAEVEIFRCRLKNALAECSSSTQQLKDKRAAVQLVFRPVPCGEELAPLLERARGLCPASASTSAHDPPHFMHSSTLLLAFDSFAFQQAVQTAVARANQALSSAVDECEKSGLLFRGEVIVVGDSLGGLILHEALLANQEIALSPAPVFPLRSPTVPTGAITADAGGVEHKEKKQRVITHLKVLRNKSSASTSSWRRVDRNSPSRLSTCSGGADSSSFVHNLVDDNNNVNHLSSRSLFDENLSSETAEVVQAPIGTVSSQSTADIHPTDSTKAASSLIKSPAPAPRPKLQYVRNLSVPAAHVSARNRLSASSSEWDSEDNPALMTPSTPASGILPEYSEGRSGALLSSLNFDPKASFLLGCPIGMVLMQRQARGLELRHPEWGHLYNMYWSRDPCATRVEPLYHGGRHNTAESSYDGKHRGCVDHEFNDPTHTDNGSSLDSYWHDCAVAKYMAEKLAEEVAADDDGREGVYDRVTMVSRCGLPSQALAEGKVVNTTFPSSTTKAEFHFQLPAKVWSRRRTRFKLANLAPNHRANDLLVLEGAPKVLSARFCYGPMDLVALSQEGILVYVCPNAISTTSGPISGQWILHSKALTDSHGRLTVDMSDIELGLGVHSVRMIVSGDHSFLDMFIGVLQPCTPTAVFSIDGSLTASMSVSGRDPRVRAGAVDVVRHWKQQRGHIIVYLTARPDMQQRLVSSWLAQHNFPHGFLFFTPSFSTDPLRQKAQLLRRLATEMKLQIGAAYGSAKDVGVYAFAGVEAARIYKVVGRSSSSNSVISGVTTSTATSAAQQMAVGKYSKKTADICICVAGGYSQHLRALKSQAAIAEGKNGGIGVNPCEAGVGDQVGGVVQGGNIHVGPRVGRSEERPLPRVLHRTLSSAPSGAPHGEEIYKVFIQRTDSLSPRSGRLPGPAPERRKTSRFSMKTTKSSKH